MCSCYKSPEVLHITVKSYGSDEDYGTNRTCKGHDIFLIQELLRGVRVYCYSGDINQRTENSFLPHGKKYTIYYHRKYTIVTHQQYFW